MKLFRQGSTWRNPFYSYREELANSLTHAGGAVLSLLGLLSLVRLALLHGDVLRVVAFSIYGISLFVLYLASTLYHTIQDPRAKKVLRKLDHISIYLLIAGTYTPFLLVSLRGPFGWTMLAIVWTMALAGMIWKLFYLGRSEVLATLMYVLMGWMCVLAYRQMVQNVPPQGLTMLFAGGVIYTIGVLIYAFNRVPYNHAIWHLFVLAGSFCHYRAILSL